MALSMDEQRMLAEIERRLAAEDPGLASRLSSFKRPGPAKLRSPRSRIIGSVFAIAAALVLSVMVYAMIPFRAHAPGNSPGVTDTQATGVASSSAPARPGHKSGATKATVTSPAAAKSAKATGASTP